VRRAAVTAALLAAVSCGSGSTTLTAAVQPTDRPTPRLVGLLVDQARAKVVAHGFTIQRIRYTASNKARGTVIRQSPPAGIELRLGEGVVIIVSGGQE